MAWPTVDRSMRTPCEAAAPPLARSGPCVEQRVSQSVGEVYERHFNYVVRLLSHLGVQADFLEDASQDVFLVVHAKLSDFDGRVAVTTWLSAIVLRVAYRYRARQKRAASFESHERLSDDTSPEADAHARGRLHMAKEALAALDEHKREVFVLSEVEQLSAPEIASLTGVPVNTVYSRLRVARQTFAAALHRLQLRRTSR
jgi:RNA polymerase sigma-70 factor (ECF subfamily)